MIDEEDEDEGFGDFKSAPSMDSNAAAYDDWGDFVGNSPGGLPHAASLPGEFFSMKPAMSSGLASSGDPGSYLAQPGSAPGRITADPALWKKPKGAIPLSIFGLEEEDAEERDPESGNEELASSGGKGRNFGTAGPGNGANISDLIASLRNGGQPGNGPELDSNGSAKLELAGGKVSGLGGDEVGSNSYAYVNEKNECGVPLNFNPSVFGSVGTPYANGATPVAVKLIANGIDGSEEEEEDDDDGWEFKFVEAEAAQRDELALVKHQNGDSMHLNGPKSSSIDVHGCNSEADEVSSNSGWISTSLDVDNGNTGDDTNSIWQLEHIDSRAQAENGNSLGGLTNNGGSSNAKLLGPNLGNNMFPLGLAGMKLHSGEVAPQKELLSVDTANQDEDPNEAEEWGFKSAQPVLQFDDNSDIKSTKNENMTTHGSVAELSNWSMVNSSMSGITISRSTAHAEEVTPDSQKRALPLSIFGEEIESDDPIISDDISTEVAKSKAVLNSSTPTLSIKDLISGLYSQMEHTSSAEQAVNHGKDGSGFTSSIIESNLSISNNDNHDTDSWEFQDASVGNMAWDKNINRAIAYPNETIDIEPEDCLTFFVKLNEELLFVAHGHLENLKKAQIAGASSVNEDEIDALYKEIQDVEFELGKGAIISTTPAAREINFKYFLDILQEPKFCMFESEYEISKKLMMVEKDSTSVMELVKLVASIVRILKLVSREKQLSYVSTWSKILAACAQELRHGALIWKKLLEKCTCQTLLSGPRGKDYVLSLGEIYRVAEVVGSSLKVYKPWICANAVDSMSLATLLNECASLWSTSGLEEALQILFDSSHVDSCRIHETLVESIKYIREMDVNALFDHVFSGVEPTCQLSHLKMLPGMKMVFWDGKPYLLTLANLWANLVNCDPPVLPSVVIQ